LPISIWPVSDLQAIVVEHNESGIEETHRIAARYIHKYGHGVWRGLKEQRGVLAGSMA
jgi:hypothetical protein